VITAAQPSVTRYIELALRLAKWDADLVDSYYGPRELADAVADEQRREPAELLDEADRLLTDVKDPWLAAQVGALRAAALRLAGNPLPYLVMTEQTYGFRPRWFDEGEFERAHALLDEALPGRGPLAVRYSRWLERTSVPASLVESAAGAFAKEFRARTQRLIGLPAGETIEIEGVTGVRWRGYAHYLGGLRTRISLNVGRPFVASDLAHITLHETYGGHHVHRVWQEQTLVRERGETERTLDVLQSPEALVSEGIAEVGVDLVMAEDGPELIAGCLRSLGLRYDAATGARVTRAMRLLRPVNSNAALLIHARGADLHTAKNYLRKWSFQSEEDATESMRRLATPVPVGYVHLYAHGVELCRSHVGGDARRLRALMTARVVPADLVPGAGRTASRMC
jgi:hypothetical protein